MKKFLSYLWKILLVVALVLLMNGVSTLIYAVIIYFYILFVYSLYKIIWYNRRMKWLRKMLEEFEADGAKITWYGKFSDIYRTQRGVPHFSITTPRGCYEISVLSHPSTHGRWLIEEISGEYHFEVRTKNRLIYRPHYTSGTEPYHSKEYRRETRLYRKEYFVAPPDPAFDKQILLIYPEPVTAAHTHNRYDELICGTKVYGKEVMFAQQFIDMVLCDLKGGNS